MVYSLISQWVSESRVCLPWGWWIYKFCKLFFTILQTKTAPGTKHSRVLLKRLTLCEHSYREDNQCSMPGFKMFLEIIMIAEIDMVCPAQCKSRIQGDWKWNNLCSLIFNYQAWYSWWHNWSLFQSYQTSDRSRIGPLSFRQMNNIIVFFTTTKKYFEIIIIAKLTMSAQWHNQFNDMANFMMIGALWWHTQFVQKFHLIV